MDAWGCSGCALGLRPAASRVQRFALSDSPPEIRKARLADLVAYLFDALQRMLVELQRTFNPEVAGSNPVDVDFTVGGVAQR